MYDILSQLPTYGVDNAGSRNRYLHLEYITLFYINYIQTSTYSYDLICPAISMYAHPINYNTYLYKDNTYRYIIKSRNMIPLAL